MTSAENELQQILNELSRVSLEMQQLIKQKKVLSIMKELKNRVCDKQIDGNSEEFNSIEKNLNLLKAKKADLQLQHDKLITEAKKVSVTADDSHQILLVVPPPTTLKKTEANGQEFKSTETDLHFLEARITNLKQEHDRPVEYDTKPKKVSFSAGELPDSPQIFVVEPPPVTPAPTVTLDHTKLQFEPCKTQCPKCLAFITSETTMSVSSLAWMACVTIAMMGCLAGCCLIPFCMDSFKSMKHKCPKCKTLITTVKKM